MKFLAVCLLLLTCIVALSIGQSEGFFNTPPTRIAMTACLKGDHIALNAKTTDNTTIPKVYVVYHSSKNSLEAGESTDQILVTNATVTKTDSTIHTFRPSNMVVGKRYYVIQVTAETDPDAKKYKVPVANAANAKAAPNTLMGVYTYSSPSPCPSQSKKKVDTYQRSRSNDDSDSSSTRTSRSTLSTPSTPISRSRYRTDAPIAAHWRTFDRQDPSGAAISGTSDQAKSLKQRMDILSDIQTLLKKKTLEERRVPYEKTCKRTRGACDGGCDGGCDGCCDGCSEKTPSAALSQGREYKTACDHDMSQYIRKDSIPCWKCNLDY